MKQVLQNARTGELEVADVPRPKAGPGCVLVRVAASIVSAGTERAAAEFASKSLIKKAQSRPDLLKEVLSKVRRDGVLATVSAVQARLDQPSALGYSCAGTVAEVGRGIDDLRPGDRVACAGAGHGVHADFASVPRMLVARIPSVEVDFESAAFSTLGAVALHAVRTAEAKVGEVVAVIGLGLLGQLAVQILRAAGCTVVGFDIVQERAALAVRMGALGATVSEEEFRDLCLQHSNGYGADSVLITAETPSSAPVNLAAQVARDRGIVVAVGAVGMDLERRPYYDKELDFRVSRSYGPGRYDTSFEQKGIDYPIGYIRWTETRNMQAFLALLADGKLDLKPLVSHRFAIENATSAYDLITGKCNEPYLGVVLQYCGEEQSEPQRLQLVQPRRTSPASPSTVRVGVLGAGNFARGVLMPAMKKIPGLELAGICASNGVRARSAAQRFGFEFCTTEEEQLFSDASINTVVIATRHHLHSRQVKRAIESGKDVFCEKPICLSEAELEDIRDSYSKNPNCRVMVGFNRRFAPFVTRMKTFFSTRSGPVTMIYRINAGPLPADHWINDPDEGGGRVLGEMCHFVDLLSFLCGAAPVTVNARSSSGPGGHDVTVMLTFADGSNGTIIYACNGDRAYSKERVEVFGSGAIAVLDDFRRLDLIRHGRRASFRSWFAQDKGHAAEWRAFSDCIRAGLPSPIPFDEIVMTTRATIGVVESLRLGCEQTIVQEGNLQFAGPLVS